MKMSPGRTPGQRSSTLAISPFVTGRQARSRGRPDASAGPSVASINPNTSRLDAFQAIVSSPLGRKTQAPQPPSTTTTTAANAPSLSTAAASAPELDASSLSSVERLRLWRHDALMQHMYAAASHAGQLVYSLTRDANDAFWLAQVYFSQGLPQRAVELLTADSLHEQSVVCRYLVGKCLLALHKYDEALDTVGEANPFKEEPEGGNGDYTDHGDDGGIRIESSLCLLRGQVYAALNSIARATECYTEALLVDVKNLEAFQKLTDGNLLSPREQWDLLDSLDFSVLGDNEALIRGMYTLCCSPYAGRDRVRAAQALLSDEYALDTRSSSAVARSHARTLYHQGSYNECLTLCEQVVSADSLDMDILPTYILTLQQLQAGNKLFLTAHRLCEQAPRSAVAWFAVATYYATTRRTHEARRFYAKSLVMDPAFASAWLGFVHTFTADGEQDQALAAGATAARFFPGNHLPNMFLGMEYMALKNWALAEEYLTLAYDVCPTDPALLNEMGVMYYHRGEYARSKKYLGRAMDEVEATSGSTVQGTGLAIQLNLAHTYRLLGDDDRAIRCAKSVLESSPRNADAYLTLGFLYLRGNELEKAIDSLHRTLALRPTCIQAQELLLSALEMNVAVAVDKDHPLLAGAPIPTEYWGTQGGMGGKKRPSGGLSAPRTVAKRVRTNEGAGDRPGDRTSEHMDVEEA